MTSRPDRFTPGERDPGTHWIWGWVDPRAGMDDLEKWKFFTLPGLKLRTLGRPARSQSLYRLRYPSSLVCLEGLRETKKKRKLIAALTDTRTENLLITIQRRYRLNQCVRLVSLLLTD
jgi:hypothetical protein